MIHTRILSPVLAALLMASPAIAQDNGETQDNGEQTGDQAETQNGMSEEEAQRAQEAADEMIGSVYVREIPDYWSPADVMDRLNELGYTDIDEFDIEWGYYEFEATSMDGNEVEIEVDPVTGTIVSIEDNWF